MDSGDEEDDEDGVDVEGSGDLPGDEPLDGLQLGGRQLGEPQGVLGSDATGVQGSRSCRRTTLPVLLRLPFLHLLHLAVPLHPLHLAILYSDEVVLAPPPYHPPAALRPALALLALVRVEE